MAVAFDGVAKTMTVSGVSTVDVQRDLYSAWKRWVRQSDNAKYLQAIRPVGGDSIGGGQSSPAYFFLMNDWKVVVDGENVEFKLNLYCEEATNTSVFPFIISNNGAASYKVSDSPIVTISSGSGLSAEQDATLNTIANKTNDIPSDVWSDSNATELLTDVSNVRKHHTNKAVISSDEQLITIYDDDGSTILHQFDLTTDKLIRIPR